MTSSTQSSELAGYGPPEEAAGAHALEGYGPPEPIEDARVDAGPEARAAHPIFGRPKMPAPKTDEELGIDRGPQYGGINGQPLFGRDAPGTELYAHHHAGDEMNDPGARLITGGALAAPAAAVAGAAAPAALAPLVSGAVSGGAQAAMQGQNPLVGAALGAIPGIGPAARAADTAIGEAALARVRPVGSEPGPIAKAAGHAVGAAAGYPVGGPIGAYVGHKVIGPRVASIFSKAGDAATNALADRLLRQELASPAASARVANLVQLPSSVSPATPGMPDAPITLAPLVSQPKPLGQVPAELQRLAPHFDEITGEPVTQAGQGGFLPEEAPTNAGAKPNKLLDDVMRDTRRFRQQTGPDVDEPPGVPLESQLERSVRMLSELKSAARAGNATPTMIRDALNAGMSPQAVAKTVGREAFEKATAQ